MSAVTATPAATGADPAVRGRPGTARRLLRNPMGLFSAVVLALVFVFGVSSTFLAPFDPGATRLDLTNAPPFSGEYLLGGDQAGRDILSRLMHATLGTMTAAAVALAVSLLVGVTSGLLAGYFAGALEAVSSWASNTIMALPGFVLLIAMYTVIGPSILTAMAVFGVLIAPSYYRMVRNLVTGVRGELYVDAAKISGLPDRRIITRHVLRAVRAPVVIQSSFVLASGISIQAALEFLGLGDPTEPSWGGMLQEAFNNIYIAGSNVVWPALLITLTTLCLVLLGNVLRDVLQSGAARAEPLRPRAVARLRAEHRTAGKRPGTGPSSPSSDAEPAPLLEVRDLVVAYPAGQGAVTQVVRGVDLAVRPGEIHGLVGESGSGKSQTALSVLGLLPRAGIVLDGRITFDGIDLRDRRSLRKVRGSRIGYVPQEPMSNLDPAFTIGAQLTYGLRAVSPLSRGEAESTILDLLARVGIKDPRRTFASYPHEISGGMAQRVLIAGAVAPGPALIIADEPTTALDVTVQAEVLDLIRGLRGERGLAMVLVTHNFGVVADICDRVSVMKEGRIVEKGETGALFSGPEDDYTRMLLASIPDGSRLREPWRKDRGR